jgi:hypothetical protein
MRRCIVGTLRLGVRVRECTYLLVDDYPPFTLS